MGMRNILRMGLGAARVGVLGVAVAAAAGPGPKSSFEVVQRINALTLQFTTDTFATHNAFGAAITGGPLRQALQDAYDASVADGSTSLLLEFPGLADLTGTAEPGVNVGFVDGAPALV